MNDTTSETWPDAALVSPAVPEFVERLDRALTALHSPASSAPATESGQA